MLCQAFPFALGAEEAQPPMAERVRLAAQYPSARRLKLVIGFPCRSAGEQRFDGGRARASAKRRPSCQRQEVLLAPQRGLARALRSRADPLVRPVGAQHARLDVVAIIRPEDLGEDSLLERRGIHREGHVDPTDEIAGHPVARGEIHLLLSAR